MGRPGFFRFLLVAGLLGSAPVIPASVRASQTAAPAGEGMAMMFSELPEDTRRQLMEKCFADRYGDFFWQETISPEKQQKIVAAFVREDLFGRAMLNQPSEARLAAREQLIGEKMAVLSQCLTSDQIKSFKHFEQTLPQRVLVHSAAARLVGTNDAFTLEQTNQLVELLFTSEVAGWTPPYPAGIWTGPDGAVKTITSRMARLPGQFSDYTHREKAAKFLNAHQIEIFDEVEKSPLTDIQFWR